MTERQDAVNPRSVTITTVPRTPAGDAFTALVLDVAGLGLRFTAKGEALAKPTGQTLARWVTLNAVSEGPATVAAISRMFGYARQSVQRIADLLVADGLATYEANPRHQRAKLLQLTPRGRSVLDRVNTAQTAWANELGGAIGEADLHRTSRVLRRIQAAMIEGERTRGRGRGA
jgi:DNA-binding MarR family transcriptional regulator